MTRRSISVLALVVWTACGHSSTGPGSSSLTVKATDPSGDTYGSLVVQWDLTGLTLTRDTGGIDFAIDLTSNARSPVTGDSDAVYGEIDFDTDQSITTGTTSFVDVFGPGTSGMGVDYVLDLFDYTPDSLVPVLRYNPNDSTYSTVYSLRPTFSGKRISGRIPLSALGNDDGFLNAAVIVGTLREPTDIAPNAGHLKVGGAIAAETVRESGRLGVFREILLPVHPYQLEEVAQRQRPDQQP
jgi:hypothetical protein